MKDIVGAIAEEEKYKKNRLIYADISLIDNLSAYGYTTLDDYFSDKKSYLLKSLNFNVYNVDEKNLENKLEQSIINKEPSIYFVTPSRLVAWNGSEPIDTNLCDSLGVEIHNLSYEGGTIISGTEDFSLVIIVPNTIDINSDYFMTKFYEFYKKYYANVVFNSNDMLIDGVKIMGAMQREVNNMFLFATQVSFVDRLDIINQICPSDSGKIAGSLANAPFDKSVLKDEVMSWLLQY